MTVIRHAVRTDPGKHHKRNEDRYYIHAERGCYFVTDGMANEITPHFILDTLPFQIRDEFKGVNEVTAPAVAEKLAGVLRELNEQARSQRHDLWASGDVGATLVLVLVRGGHALLAHLGDSRIYLHRAGQLEQLTRDHSQVQKMLDSGQITPAEAVAARTNGGPTRYIGMMGKAHADVRVLELKSGDRLLLCSDGLTEMLMDGDILAILNKTTDPDAACERLVAAANLAGGHDNITVVLVAVD